MIDEYARARKKGEHIYKTKTAQGEYPFLPALDDVLPASNTLSQQPLGLMEIPLALVAGTKTRARQNAFAPGFMPLLEPDTEFAMKWSSLYRAQMTEGFNSPIRVYEYLHRFYVLEGNKRVSVSRFLDIPVIMADVVRILPDTQTLEVHPAYREFLDFYRAVPIYDIECTKEGSYGKIAALFGRGLTEPWPEEAVKDLQAGYWRFARATGELQTKIHGMTMGDAFLIYLNIFRGENISGASEHEVEKRLKSIKKELYTAQNKEKVSLIESSEEALHAGSLIGKAEKLVTRPGSLVSKVIPALSYSLKNPLKAAFIYAKSPEESNWVYNHEVGRLRVEKTYGGSVLTKAFIVERDSQNAADSESDAFGKAVGEAVSWGADVVFTTSIRHNPDTLRAAIQYQDVKFLNCSINLANQAVRTYYAKLYEAKFLAGIVAGSAAAADGTHKIGYCSDYPVYGTIAAINAFAIGAAMADPAVTVYLDWTGKKDNNWWQETVEKGFHVISAVDSTHNTDGSNVYGVCCAEKAAPGEGTDASGQYRITNLAAPIWKWGKLYEIIIRTILDGTYHAKLVDRKDQATNYWWGMISGVVDIEVSDAVSPYTAQLVDILRTDIICASLNPFDGELRSQEGIVRREGDEPLSSMEIIQMDWLNENIVGEIPEPDILADEARETVSVSGVRKTGAGSGGRSLK